MAGPQPDRSLGSIRDGPPRGAEQTAVASRTRNEIPKIVLRDLENWILNRKRDRSITLENKDEIMMELGLRDHVFIIDDAESMKQYWREREGVINLAKALAYVVKESDKNGMELFFTCSDDKYKVYNSTTMEARLSGRLCHSRSNMAVVLGRILENYRTSLKKNSEDKGPVKFFQKLKPLNIYVFTDAEWQPYCDVDVAKKISLLATTMKDLKYPREQVGIQFIRFGNDRDCSEKLRCLDEGIDMEIPKGYDIVDTEPAVGGNCWKMLVGAINKWFDSANEPEPANHHRHASDP